ncbi:unnamed protein product [Rotaria sordida]|uniref:Uncharacterized protein n=1 Tax=Rotaria sordida TaxID=392033 RepID=A0A814YCE7_9BILA|nr:unnamed protein product [Rotaria sordida]CAF1509988.1 unnamed protein product [Rotaria sordida]
MKKKRSVCQHSWLIKYSWLSYSKIHQGVYCRYCVLFSRKGENQALGQFINKQLRSLKDAIEYLSNHDKCDYHKFSVNQATECISRYPHANSDVNILLNNINEQQQNENRRVLASIIKCILFLSKQNIAFRGNDKDEFLNDNNINPGNFTSLVLFTAEAGDQALQKHLNHHQKNATYLSWQTQNELINICARLIKNKLLNELTTTLKFYAIIADETSDLSGTEQLSISIRFVSDENDILIKEIFLGFEALSATTAVGIAKAITTFIQTSDLKIEKIRGQGYDGANVVAGKLGGVQKLIKDIVPRANYFHCSNHSLDLVLAEACTLQLIKMFFGVIKSVINFINASPNRKRMLAKAIESTNNETKRRHLVKLCETRWVDKQTSIIVFKQVFFDVIIALDYLAENGDSETSGLVRSYGKALNDIDFAIPLIIVNRVFCITKPYAEQFQKPTCDLLKCFQSIEQALTYLAQLIYDDNELNELYNEFTKFVELHEIDNCLSRTTSRRYEFVKNYFTDVYRTFINTTIEELGRRFNEHQKIAMHISNLIPSYFVNTQFSNVLPLFHCYKDDLLSDDPNIHKAEFDRWKFSVLQMKENERPSTIIETLKIMQPIKSFYPNIYILLQIYALIPVSVAGAERSFSVLKLIKTKLRNRIGDERCNDKI